VTIVGGDPLETSPSVKNRPAIRGIFMAEKYCGVMLRPSAI
jgi:hypothetical protein